MIPAITMIRVVIMIISLAADSELSPTVYTTGAWTVTRQSVTAGRDSDSDTTAAGCIWNPQKWHLPGINLVYPHHMTMSAI